MRGNRQAGALGLAAITSALCVLVGCSGNSETDASQTTNEAPVSDVTTSAVGSPPMADVAMPVTVEQVSDLPGYTLYRPADLAAAGAPMPVVVWANGGCVRHSSTWAPLLERWAEAGLVVIAISEPVEGGPEGSTTPADQARAIDWALQQDDVEDSPYAGRLDGDRVVAAGNSCGGITSVNLAAEDPRVAAVFVVSGSAVLPGSSDEAISEVVSAVTVPLGYAVGGDEDIAKGNAIRDLAALTGGVPGYLASRATGDHLLVSTDPGILVEAAEIGINFLDLALNGTPSALDALLTRPCWSCAPGLWSVTAQDLETLVRS